MKKYRNMYLKKKTGVLLKPLLYHVKQIKELIQKKARLLITDELLDNELREQKNIITNLSNYEAQNQVNQTF